MSENMKKLSELMCDIFMLDEEEFNIELNNTNVDGWDSLGVVSVAVGLHETFGYHLTPDEANSITSVKDILTLLSSKGISFD